MKFTKFCPPPYGVNGVHIMDDLSIKVAATFKQIRKDKGFTQLELSEISNVSKSTIDRLERGDSIPQLFNLRDLLSPMGVSLDEFFSLSNGTNMALFNSDFAYFFNASLDQDYKKMTKILTCIKSKPYCNDDIPVIRQSLLIMEAILLHEADNNCQSALTKYIDALSITMPPKFMTIITKTTDQKMHTYKLTMNEYRILKGTSNVFNSLGDITNAIRICALALSFLEVDTNSYEIQKRQLPTFYFNLSNMLIDIEDYGQALEIANKGIAFCLKSKELKFISYLRWNKGRALFYIGEIDHAHILFKHAYDGAKDIGGKALIKKLEYVAKTKYNLLLK